MVFEECAIVDRQIVVDTSEEYHKHIKEHKGISSIIDARSVQSCSKVLAFSMANYLRRYDELTKSNLISMAIILDKPRPRSVTRLYHYTTTVYSPNAYR